MLKLGRVTQSMPTTYGPYTGQLRPLMSAPNMKRIALFVLTSYKGVTKYWNGSRDHGHTHLGYFAVHMQQGSIFHLCTEFEVDSSIRFKVIRVPKFRNWATWPRKRPLRGHLVVCTQVGSVIYVCTNFEVDSSIHSKVIKGLQILEIGSRYPGHAHLGSFCGPCAGGVRPQCAYQIWSERVFA